MAQAGGAPPPKRAGTTVAFRPRRRPPKAGRAPIGHPPRRPLASVARGLEPETLDDGELIGAAEASVIAQWRSAVDRGDLSSAGALQDFLVRANWSLVRRRTRRFRISRLSADDLEQAGAIGLLEALRRFDPQRGRLGVYAGYWIRKEQQRCLASGEFPVALPAHLPGRLVGLRQRPPGDARRSAEAALGRWLDQPLILEVGEDRPWADPAPGIEALVERAELAVAIERALAGLSEPLRSVVVLRFGLGEEEAQSARAIGRRLGVSDFTVRARLAKALALLAESLSALR